MTPAELNQPWRDFDVHLVPWRAVLRRGAHEASLEADELLNACAAFELGRHPQAVVHVAITQRAQGRRAALPWADLVDGACGLQDRSRAPGELSLGYCLRELGVDLVRIEHRNTQGNREPGTGRGPAAADMENT